ncbi:MAG: hypothetical protein PVJ67_03785 [Candidatus Pacearchaeota archaeon]|jgi:hypothetical protein
MWDKIKTIIGTIAPTIATVIGSPLAGLAVNELCKILGLKDNATSADILESLQKATPEQLLAIKKSNADLKIKLKELGIEENKMYLLDIADARSREIEIAKTGRHDYTTSFLAISLTIGFFGLLIILMRYDIRNKDILQIMLGSLATAFIGIFNYYFGTSKSSSEKNKILENTINRKNEKNYINN